jgi:hypothetical protein
VVHRRQRAALRRGARPWRDFGCSSLIGQLVGDVEDSPREESSLRGEISVAARRGKQHAAPPTHGEDFLACAGTSASLRGRSPPRRVKRAQLRWRDLVDPEGTSARCQGTDFIRTGIEFRAERVALRRERTTDRTRIAARIREHEQEIARPFGEGPIRPYGRCGQDRRGPSSRSFA